ncbi:MAG: DUF4188 domain-containing protein [Ignavibacteria bacterium]|nr:DUF4188 domain-containing protein [Ignavibacteria bacterium]
MAKLINGRKFAAIKGDFVVFLIGMRINSFWKIHKWLPVVIAMPKMLKELYNNPEYGFLDERSWFGRNTISVQYWRSFEHLENYAKNKNLEHFPAWVAFNKKVSKNNAVGVWHETYKISQGNYENIYINMPIFGLGKAGEIDSAEGKNNNAAGRMNRENIKQN